MRPTQKSLPLNESKEMSFVLRYREEVSRSDANMDSHLDSPMGTSKGVQKSNSPRVVVTVNPVGGVPKAFSALKPALAFIQSTILAFRSRHE